MSKTLLWIGGVYNLIFFVFHLLFWRIFDWKRTLASLTPLNRAIMQVLNLSLAFVFVIFGMLSLLHPDQMAETELGQLLVGMIALFWLLRSIAQVVFFKMKRLLSWGFLFVFLTGAGLYGTVLWLTM